VAAPDPAVELTRAASAADRAALHRLYALYLHDLSEFTAHYALDADARWTPSYLDDMLSRPVCHCLLARSGGAAAGFALVATQPFPYMPADADVHLAEFFVAKPYRRRGLGRAMADATLRRFPGRWNLAVVDANAPAFAFWRKIVSEVTGGDYAEVEGSGDTSFRFSVG
jgi:predicted acetyltransferase